MSAYTSTYLEAIEHLPDGAMLRLEDISWDEYEQLLDQLTEWRGMRVSYDHGRVEIDENYVERDASLSFPFLTAQAMTQFLEQSKTQGQTPALAALRLWVRAAVQA